MRRVQGTKLNWLLACLLCSGVVSCGDDESCTENCGPTSCGDGAVQEGEACDDGNTVDDDECTNQCTAPTCGDEIVQAGEECDPPNGTSCDESCQTVGSMPGCGDGEVNDGEECDDGNSSQTDGCTNDCTLPSCGDELVQAGEQCDDGNTVDDDFCNNACELPNCGDGVMHPWEGCDDGNTTPDDACDNDCALVVCGNGKLQASEGCDDGNAVDDDECTNDCTLPNCGDGIVQAGEACDDSNTLDGDGCDANCQPSCGNGVIDASDGEGCDDGGASDGDGCDSLCQVEAGFSCQSEPSVCALLPVATPDAVAGVEDTQLTINAATLLANDLAPGGGALTLVSVSNPTNGTVSLASGVVTFTPTTHVSGDATFEYSLSNGVDTVTTEVTIALEPVADAPTLAAADVGGLEDTFIQLGVQSALVDVDGSEALTVEIEGIPSESTLSAGTVISTEHNLVMAQPPTVALNAGGAGLTESSATVADFDLDGNNDVFILANTPTTTNPVRVFFGNGDGTLSATVNSVNSTSGFATEGAVVALFNNDAYPDAIVPLFDGLFTLSVHLNNGAGRLVASNAASSTTVSATAITAGRFNSDGLDDVVIDELNSNNLRIFLGNNAGVLGAGTSFPGIGTIRKDCLSTGDFNNDGDLDIVGTTTTSPATTGVWFGNGDGTFSAPVTTVNSTGSGCQISVEVGDLNGDSDLDLVYSGGFYRVVMFGNGAGGFTIANTALPTGSSYQHMALALVDNDDILDVITTNGTNREVAIGNGDGTFQITTYPGSLIPGADIAVGRLDSDSFDDAAFVGGLQFYSASRAYVLLTQARDTVQLTSAQLPGFLVRPPPNLFGSFPLIVTGYATELANGDVAATAAARMLTVDPLPN